MRKREAILSTSRLVGGAFCCGIATEAAIFAYLLFSYYYMAIELHGAWYPSGPPSLKLALPNTFVLLASSVAFWWAERHFIVGRLSKALVGAFGRRGLGRHLSYRPALRMA